jgi:hypothetical protein
MLRIVYSIYIKPESIEDALFYFSNEIKNACDEDSGWMKEEVKTRI